jgi:hypothetical protein
MCDYSIEMYRSRPAQTGEKYVLTRFGSGSLGLASPGDCDTAVCVPYETRLLLEDVPERLRDKFGIDASAEVTFVPVEHGRYRDGVRFADGTEVSLQALTPGITVWVSRALDRPVEALRRETGSVRV